MMSWSKLSKAGALGGVIGGMVMGLVAWFVTASTTQGGAFLGLFFPRTFD